MRLRGPQTGRGRRPSLRLSRHFPEAILRALRACLVNLWSRRRRRWKSPRAHGRAKGRLIARSRRASSEGRTASGPGRI
eukprot:402376-Alexandrium_andersonii.AAC.1